MVEGKEGSKRNRARVPSPLPPVRKGDWHSFGHPLYPSHFLSSSAPSVISFADLRVSTPALHPCQLSIPALGPKICIPVPLRPPLLPTLHHQHHHPVIHIYDRTSLSLLSIKLIHRANLVCPRCSRFLTPPHSQRSPPYSRFLRRAYCCRRAGTPWSHKQGMLFTLLSRSAARALTDPTAAAKTILGILCR
jgi:hypothetical protein